ncbi:hypothetical protein FQR65_LT11824 [Abscondita terminalis]|nr:hypothetical protein FQR65_LT11824 [Abscondita terminalis]
MDLSHAKILTTLYLPYVLEPNFTYPKPKLPTYVEPNLINLKASSYVTSNVQNSAVAVGIADDMSTELYRTTRDAFLQLCSTWGYGLYLFTSEPRNSINETFHYYITIYRALRAQYGKLQRNVKFYQLENQIEVHPGTVLTKQMNLQSAHVFSTQQPNVKDNQEEVKESLQALLTMSLPTKPFFMAEVQHKLKHTNFINAQATT